MCQTQLLEGKIWQPKLGCAPSAKGKVLYDNAEMVRIALQTTTSQHQLYA